jgi:biotin carboxyl carrier protein
MPGQVRRLAVQVGQTVNAGDVLVLLEAMKMEIRIQAPHAAKVARIAVSEGQSVEREQILVELDGETA